jgi:hypothetical protein
MDQHMEEPGRPMVMPVFAGQKLVVVGGSSGMNSYDMCLSQVCQAATFR